MEPTNQTASLISVIIPLPDHRGMAIKAIESWCKKQQYPPEKYEVVIVSDASNPQLEESVQSYLRPHDYLIKKEKANIPELINFGVQKANHELLFITESHCIASIDCLDQISQYFSSNNIDLACCSSDGINKNHLAKMEQKVFDLDFQKRCLPESWNKITVRGFGIKRSVYLSVNGLESQYGHFAEPILGSRLQESGYRMGYAAKVKVSHYNNSSLKYLLPSLVEYGEDKVEYFLHEREDYIKKYFSSDFYQIQRELQQRNIITAQWNCFKRLLRLKLYQVYLLLLRENSDHLFSAYQKVWNASINYGQSKRILQQLSFK